MKTHTVKRGETLSKIAMLHDTTVRDLVSLNGIKNPNIIRVGQVLQIPEKKVAQAEVIKIINDTVADIQALPNFKKFLELIEND